MCRSAFEGVGCSEELVFEMREMGGRSRLRDSLVLGLCYSLFLSIDQMVE